MLCRPRGKTVRGNGAVLLFVALAVAAPPAELFVADREIAADIPINGVPPIWGGGALLGVESSEAKAPVLYVVDREGSREAFPFSIPESSLINILGIARADDGTIALCGGSVEITRTTFIAILPPDRKRQKVIKTWPYHAEQIALAADGTLWTAGTLTNGSNTRAPASNVLRRYDRSGKLQASWTVNAKANAATEANTVDASSAYLLASLDRVGWLSNSGEYLEYALDGQELGRYPPPERVISGPPGAGVSDQNAKPHVLDAALSRNNELVICVFRAGKTPAWQLWRLDRQARMWSPATAEHAGYNSIAGFDGDDPIMLPAVGGAGRIQWLKRAVVPVP